MLGQGELKGSLLLLTLVPSLLTLLGHSCLGILQCPLLPAGSGNCNHSCANDTSCPPHKMCCYSGSCRTCVDPVDMPPTCENSRLTCNGNQKCFLQIVECTTGSCYPVPVCAEERQVACQPVSLLVEGFPMDLCSDDSMCPTGRKCCSNGNGHDCQAVRVDSLPRRPHSLSTDTHESDCETVDCEEGKTCVMVQQKCPESPCPPPQPQCLEPWSLKCPSEILQGACDMFADECSTTAGATSCRRGTNCCNIGCGNVCMRPTVELPGYCPEDPPDGTEGDQCVDDSECSLGCKCCRNHCSAVVLEKPGTQSTTTRQPNTTTDSTTITIATETTTIATSTSQKNDNILPPICPDGIPKEDVAGSVLSCTRSGTSCPLGSYCHRHDNGQWAVCCPHPLSPAEKFPNGADKKKLSLHFIFVILAIYAAG